MSYFELAEAPLILGIVGKSDTGKTTLILNLIPELVKRGYKVGTAKNCPHGFNIDKKGKDSWRFSQSGSGGVLLISPDEFVIARKREKKDSENILGLFTLLFNDFDIVLVEGFSSLQKVRKIELLRKEISDKMDPSLRNVVAVISDVAVKTDKPVFKPNEIINMVDFMEKEMEKDNKEKNVEVLVNGKKVPLNFFLQQVVKNLAIGVVEPLKRKNKEEKIREVSIKVSL